MTLLNNRLLNEIKYIKNNENEYFSVGPININDLTHWQGILFGPKDTPYYKGIFNLDIIFNDEYPFKPPKILFKTPIYHCNININGYICLDILIDKWSPLLSINKLLLSICSILSEPIPDDPLVPEIAYLYKHNKKLHDINATNYTLKFAF
jgi:ubiquitin-conjugating enzyme E2 D/E